MQRRAAARARSAPALAARWPAYFVAFDVLQLDGQDLLTRPYKDRRPMTTDLTKAREWLQTWTDVSVSRASCSQGLVLTD
ncbi:ATP-dependent DNA ligase [Streptomyces goshikiensis]